MPADALAALGLLLDAAGALAAGGEDAWPSAMPLMRALALQAGERYLGARLGPACHRVSRLECMCRRMWAPARVLLASRGLKLMLSACPLLGKAGGIGEVGVLLKDRL